MTNPNWWGVQSLAAFSHDVYEAEAVKAGWKTQEQCRVPFDELPEANKTVMLAVASAIIAEVEKRGEARPIDIGKRDIYARWYECDSCREDGIIEDANFCPHCGLKINWK